MSNESHRPGDWWAHLLADIFIRVLYAVGTAFLLFYMGRRFLLHATGPGPWIGVAVISLLVAAFGPAIHREDVERGRGSLDEIKRNSKKR